MAREGVQLRCTECKEINYLAKRDKRKNPDKLRLKKFCSRCNSSQEHTETKK